MIRKEATCKGNYGNEEEDEGEEQVGWRELKYLVEK